MDRVLNLQWERYYFQRPEDWSGYRLPLGAEYTQASHCGFSLSGELLVAALDNAY